MTVVVVQSRLGSTRLPGKGLLDLAGKPVIAHVLMTMKHVKADSYYLATDFDSYDRLEPVAKSCGWECFAGSADDVLNRFCRVAEKTDADIIVRATGDNPFLFYDAAQASLERFVELSKTDRVDYFTYSGLPHGCGVEVLNARTLLDAEKNTTEPYDHEHVGPAFYNHKDKFTCVFENAPEEWNHPKERTTIDTYGDFRNAERIMYALKKAGKASDYSSQDVLNALREPFVKNTILFVPSVEAGHGTGHLRRCLDLTKSLTADIFIPNDASLSNVKELLNDASLEPFQIVRELPVFSKAEVRPLYSLIVADYFALPESLASALWKLAPVVALDEGSVFTDYCDYLLDIIPSAVIERRANYKNSSFIPLPNNKKTEFPMEIRTALVCIGGEDPAGFTASCAGACRSCGLTVTEVTPENPVQNLREKLADYDLVVTHYGFTAFEAAAAGCAVILVETTPLHKTLSESEGFVCVPASIIKNASSLNEVFAKLLENRDVLFRQEKIKEPQNDSKETEKKVLDCTDNLPDFLRQLSLGSKQHCTICGCSENPDEVVFRSKEKTYRCCSRCGTLYLSWIFGKEEKYGESYFFEEYKKQYGKTYLEDFASIKAQGMRRVSIINKIAGCTGKTNGVKTTGAKKLLDIGCAFGPFLAAAAESGWEPYGTDVSDAAVSYVNEKLGFKAEKAQFPDGSFKNLPEKYDAVTMWYVIEHFKNLDAVLAKVSDMVRDGGVFAFSTPSATGVSARFSSDSFFKNSPKDHFTILDMKKCLAILKKYGFSTIKCVSTGHHPERFPCLASKKHDSSYSSSFGWKLISRISWIFKLGDTFELYCVKNTKNTKEVSKK